MNDADADGESFTYMGERSFAPTRGTARNGARICFSHADVLLKNRRKESPPLIETGDKAMDAILGGGVIPGMRYLIHAPVWRHTVLLERITVSYLLNNSGKVLYVDGLNEFDVYRISAMAALGGLAPGEALERIVVGRAFNNGQIAEILAEKTENIENVGIILIAGLTEVLRLAEIPEVLMEIRDRRNLFRKLKEIITGLNRTILHSEEEYGMAPTIIATGTHHPDSPLQPFGGNLIKHYFQVILGIYEENNGARYTDYTLQQHPSLRERRMRVWHISGDLIHKAPERGKPGIGRYRRKIDKKRYYDIPLERFLPQKK